MNSLDEGRLNDLSLYPSLHAPQTPDIKKEEFRKYLEKAGVVDALTRGALQCNWQPAGANRTGTALAM